MRVAVLTISDTVASGERVDLSGPAVVQRCRDLGWEITSALRCSDDPDQVRSHLRKLADSRSADLILTTGGTGLGPRDNTPEATLEIGEKVVPGLAEESSSICQAAPKAPSNLSTLWRSFSPTPSGSCTAPVTTSGHHAFVV